MSLAGAYLASAAGANAGPPPRPRVAAVFTQFTHRSHAHVILENFLAPYLFNGRRVDPPVDVVSFYADQTPQNDLSRQVAEAYGVSIYPTIEAALCLGGHELSVDAVLSIGEHGDYPLGELGQRQYPRKRFFDECAAVVRRAGRGVPLFNDKHLSYRWDWAQEMVDVARELKIPFMAGSSVPLAQRVPALHIDDAAAVEEAVAIHGGPLESYDFHGLEILQSLVEARRGGETGISRVEFLAGEDLWSAAREGRWSLELAHAAMQAETGDAPVDLAQLAAEGEKGPVEPHGLVLTYKDGLRGTVLKLGQRSTRWNFACRLAGQQQPKALRFYGGPWNNRNFFKALAHAIQHHFVHGQSPYPVERTLLVTGVLEAAMQSRHDGRPIVTPHLEWGYEPQDFSAMREMGATWQLVTEDVPEPSGIDPTGASF
jgi:hypothetical protein